MLWTGHTADLLIACLNAKYKFALLAPGQRDSRGRRARGEDNFRLRQRTGTAGYPR
jgi:hypothetical protein